MGKEKETWVDWNDAENLQQVISASKSRVEVMKKIGYHPGSAYTRRKLNTAIKKFNLDISSFTDRTERWDILPTIISECFCIGDVLKAVGLTDQGDNHKTAKHVIKEMQLNLSHFCRKSKDGSRPKYTNEELFVENCKAHRHIVKKRVLDEKIIPHECSKCGNAGKWMGKPITLELEHKNGINNDNRLENLEFLCPNCHSQTPTHRGKSRV